MIDSIQKIYDDIFYKLKEYLENNSSYNPYVKKREPNDKLFPLVVIKELYETSKYTTLSYGDEIYNMDLEINIYAIQNGKIANVTIANEITFLIEKFFKENYKVNIKISLDVANIDTTVMRNLITVSFKIETKYKDKLVISPK